MKVLVTGGHGMLGCHIQDKIWTTSHEGIFVSSKDYDLTSQFQVRKMFEEIMPDAVIHAAARVGGAFGARSGTGTWCPCGNTPPRIELNRTFDR